MCELIPLSIVAIDFDLMMMMLLLSLVLLFSTELQELLGLTTFIAKAQLISLYSIDKDHIKPLVQSIPPHK